MFSVRQTVELNATGVTGMAHAYGHVGDANAHEWTLTVVRGGAPVDLTDFTGIAKINNGVGTVQLECAISGNTAKVVLPAACYVNAGDHDAWMQLTSPDLTAVAIIAQMQLHIAEGETDNPLDPGTGIAEQLGAVLGLMGDMVEARDEANEAATAANLAAASAAAASELKILGLYESLEALKAAHPSGVSGEAYAVGDEEENAVYIWDADTQEWASLGSLQAVAGTYQPRTDSLTPETSLADGDAFPFHDASAGLPKKTLWSSIKAALGTVFAAITHTHALDGETVTGVLPLSKGGLGVDGTNKSAAIANLFPYCRLSNPTGDTISYNAGNRRAWVLNFNTITRCDNGLYEILLGGSGATRPMGWVIPVDGIYRVILAFRASTNTSDGHMGIARLPNTWTPPSANYMLRDTMLGQQIDGSSQYVSRLTTSTGNLSGNMTYDFPANAGDKIWPWLCMLDANKTLLSNETWASIQKIG